MTVRLARFQDIPALVDLFQDGLARSKYADGLEMDVDQAKSLLLNCISAQTSEPGLCVALVADGPDRLDGVFLGVCTALYEALPVRVASNVMWFVRPDADARAGVKLLTAFEAWAARSEGKTLVRVGLSDTMTDPKKVAPLLQRNGFRISGLIFEKET